MAKNEGGFAFGANGYARPNGDFAWPVEGMTMRQWYKGMIAAVLMKDFDCDLKYAKETAETIGKFADALIAEDEQARKEGT